MYIMYPVNKLNIILKKSSDMNNEYLQITSYYLPY